MSIRRVLPALLLAGVTALAVHSRAAAASCELAITHVNLVPMTAETILPDRTVRIQGGRIATIVKTRSGGPHCQVTIDGHGGYLLPGLNDLHMHLDTEAFAQAMRLKAAPVDFPGALAPYLANGITGVRVMSGAPDILAFRNRERAVGSVLPRMMVASPMLSGAPPVIPEPLTRVVTTPEAAWAAVDEYASAGYDFIKVRDNLKAPVLRAAIEEARRRGLYVDGHLSQGQGLSVADVLAAGQHGVAHIDNLALAMTSDDDAARFAKLLVACGCLVSTTLQVEANAVEQIERYDAMIARPGVRLMDPALVAAFWAKPNNGYIAGKADPAFFRDLLTKDGLLLRTFVAAGVHVVAGTDALNPMILPGESLHDELEAMVAAGLTPYQALRTATASPAAFVPGFADVGELVAGKAANAVLVAGDPLKDLTTTRTPLAVMSGGRWLTVEMLARRLERAAASYAGK